MGQRGKWRSRDSGDGGDGVERAAFDAELAALAQFDFVAANWLALDAFDGS